jgi:hypothetical protein
MNKINSTTSRNLREAIQLSERASERSLRVARKVKEPRPHYPAMGHNCSCLDCSSERNGE